MPERDHDRDVADEQAANSNYQESIRKAAGRNPEIAVPASSKWTGTGLPKSKHVSAGPLVGRVGLAGKDDIVGSDDFYIGPWKDTHGEAVVFSWAAPVAASFYESSSEGYTLDHPVIVRRAFSHDETGAAIVDFDEDWAVEPFNHDNPFNPDKGLVVPAPPSTTQAKPRSRAPQPPAPETPNRTQRDEHQPVAASPLPPPMTQPREPTQPKGAGLRAEKALRAALSKPRSTSLPTLLATLQPDQYDFVTRTPALPLVIQGHPGTGKTVIAAHRAAYLMHPDNQVSTAVESILMVGPSRTYAQHVSGILDALVPGEVRAFIRVEGIAQALGLMRRQPKTTLSGPLDGHFFEVSIELGDFAEAVAHELRVEGRLDDMTMNQAGKVIYDAVRSNEIDGLVITDDQDMARNLKKLPSWERAITVKRLHPLVTQCIWAAAPDPSITFDHMIIDEAQDIRPLEWRLLKEMNKSMSWTILGDLNQRRSDWSYASWSDIAYDAEITEGVEEFQPETFALGYRSTQQIMTYANKLLPRHERHADNIQDEGPKPSVLKSSQKDLVRVCVDTAIELAQKYAEGTIAIITTTAQDFLTYMRKTSWVLDARDGRKLSKDSLVIYLLTPENSRGLEFDGVVVVEPDLFPRNLGRYGALYTSLTRANRELAVVHAQPLPDPLRKR